MIVCHRCKNVVWSNGREFEGKLYHSYCHRSLITERYERLVDALKADIPTYFRLSGAYREIGRIVLRQLIVEYRELSY